MLLEVVLCTPGFAAHLNDPDSPGLAVLPSAFAEVTHDAAEPVPLRSAGRTHQRKRPSPLPMLYAGLTALQTYDTFLTVHLVRSGQAHEVNPLMKSVTGNPVAFATVKTGVTVASILTAEHLWKNHNRSAAIALMIASNVMLGVVAAHNTRALQ